MRPLRQCRGTPGHDAFNKEKDSMKSILKPFALAALALLISLSALAQTPEASILRVTDPLDVGGTILQPGVYTIRVLPSFENRNQIQVTSPDLKKVYATVLTVPHYVQPNEEPANTTFVYYPAIEGQPTALRTWYAAFPDASQGGHDIVYQKGRAEQLARLSHSKVISYEDQTASNLNTVPLEVVTPEATVETYTPVPTTQTTQTTSTTTVTTPALTTETTTPAPMTSATPAPAPTEVAEAAPAAMPRTASNMPLLALLGLGAIGGAIALRFGRSI
jgi:hypothetical protein